MQNFPSEDGAGAGPELAVRTAKYARDAPQPGCVEQPGCFTRENFPYGVRPLRDDLADDPPIDVG